jgi:hypothetical protein
VEVRFYAGARPEDGGLLVCTTRTDAVIESGETQTVRCYWPEPPEPALIWVRVDPSDRIAECEEGNNDGRIPGAGCEGVE